MPRRVLDARHRRPVGKRLHLCRQGRRALPPLKRVFSSFDRVAVHHARNLLEAEGIEAEVRREMLSSAMGELPPAECQAEVWVLNDADEPRAVGVLRRPAPTGPAWVCAGCGETLAAQFTQCWKCGSDRY